MANNSALPVKMTLLNGRSKAFATLHEAVQWMREQEMPRSTARVAVSMPEDMKAFLRDCGKMSTQIRALIAKSIGAHWKSYKTGEGKKIKLGTEPKKAKRA